MKSIGGGVLAASGFIGAGVSCGIKVRRGALDLGLIVSDRLATVAGMFTSNRVKAAPVQLDMRRVVRGRAAAIVVNSGNANACTGKRGMADAKAMSALAAEAIGANEEDVLVASTGIIGRPMPMAKVTAGIRDAAGRLGRHRAHSDAITCAIMTTDTFPKSAAVELTLGRKKVRIGGIAKGAGMIAPHLATMLSFVTTDCAISCAMLRQALGVAAEHSYNCVTIDGDMSTNDTALLLANGAAGNRPILATGKDYEAFTAGLTAVCADLAQGIARDGEGATKFVEVKATGGKSFAEARQVARAIANSLLVKCAINGEDPNWGRIICAAGYSGVTLAPERLKLRINGALLFTGGMPAKVAPKTLAACMKPKRIAITLDLGAGKHSATVWTCDMSHEYVTINAEYHT